VLLRDQERQRALRYQAKQLADTGRYGAWREIEAAMVRDGRAGAPVALADVHVRQSLDKACANAQRRIVRRD
jgi:hypothetical protein